MCPEFLGFLWVLGHYHYRIEAETLEPAQHIWDFSVGPVDHTTLGLMDHAPLGPMN